jgi:hypothetical protein
VSCQEVSERLPWLLNGSLEADEQQRVRRHLESCPACRRELGETRWAAAVFGAHLPPAVLVDLAWDRSPATFDPDLARRHLESCPACAEELALVRESRKAEAETEGSKTTAPALRVVPRRPLVVRYAGLAASLTVAFGAGVLWRGSQRTIEPSPGPVPSPGPSRSPGPGETPGPGAGDPERRRLEGRVAELEGEVKRLQSGGAALETELRDLREGRAALERQVQQLDTPQPNLPVVELFPGGQNPRSAGAAPLEVVIPPGAAFVALLLNAERPSPQPALVEIRDEKGTLVWSGRGLEPSPLGGYTLGVPASLLRTGRYTIGLRARADGPAETYPIQVRRGP